MRLLVFGVLQGLRRRIALWRFNDFTIAELFRRQGAVIGRDCRIMIRSFGSEPFLISIGNHCTLAPDVSLITHDGGAWIFTHDDPTLQKFGRITILDNCFIGLRATVLPGVTIGPNSIVGACSLVTKDVPPNTVVAGNPARPVCDVETYRSRVQGVWERQRPAGYLDDLVPGRSYSPEEIQTRKAHAMGLLKAHLQRELRQF